MKTGIKVLIRTEVRDAVTGAVQRFQQSRPNMVFDAALTRLATGAINFTSLFDCCKIGSSAAAQQIPGNALTFTQVGNTITASGIFFTGPMVGGIFKYGVGTGGAEQYIAGVAGGGLSCTVVGQAGYTGGLALPTQTPGAGITLLVDVTVVAGAVTAIAPTAGHEGTGWVTGDTLTFIDATGTGYVGSVTALAGAVTAISIMTVPAATAGTVWLVQQTALTTPLVGLAGGCVSNSYVTSPGACSTSFPGGANSTQIKLQRTYQFPVQAAPYTVNEIGYNDIVANNGNVNGRIVLALPDTIAITEYYVVQIAVTYSLQPSHPTALANVGTGINTAGQIMFNVWDCNVIVPATGINTGYQTGYSSNLMDVGPPLLGLHIAGAPLLNLHVNQAQVAPARAYGSVAGTAWSNAGLPVGRAQSTIAFNFSTAGQTVDAIYFAAGNGGNAAYAAPIFVLVLTAPFALPNGTYQGNFVYQRAITRTLTN
jgi:hypothetical protein